MHKKFTLLLFFFTFLFQGRAQDNAFELKISPDKLKTDFSMLVSTLKENHPKLYDYISEEQFDSLANNCMDSLTSSLTEGEFHLRVRKFIQVIACGHTSAKPSKSWYRSVAAYSSVIPIHVVLLEDELYIRTIFADPVANLIGARIISIDGVSASAILTELKSIAERDGFGETMINQNVERLFQTYYAFVYGLKKTYSIQVQKKNGENIKLSLNGMFAKKYPSKESLEVSELVEMNDAKFGMLSDFDKTAVLDLSSFPSKGYKKFYRKVFKRLAKMDSTDLLIDLRGNSGGYFPNGNQLLRYLMNQQFTMDFSSPAQRPKKNDHLKMDFSSKMTRFIFNTIPDTDKEDPDRNYQIRYQAIKRNHFDGKIYVLTDGLTFSTGSFVASKLKNSRDAVLVGQETGGGEVSFNAVLSSKLTLPNSGVVVTIPMYHVDVRPGIENSGRGVMPMLSLEEFLGNRLKSL